MSQPIPIQRATGYALVHGERLRQINELRYCDKHDDRHVDGAIGRAAFCYRLIAMEQIKALKDGAEPIGEHVLITIGMTSWPWERAYWRPSLDPVRNLVKAGALYLAESARLTRAGCDDASRQFEAYGWGCGREIDEYHQLERPTLRDFFRKHAAYANYVFRHKWYVFQACCRRNVIWRGIVHDLSKFRPSEWLPYAEMFYGRGAALKAKRKRIGVLSHDDERELDRIQVAFDRAWLLHQHRNDHHWQHWLLREDNGGVKLLKMSQAARDEMLADWDGAGRAITGKVDTAAWYARNRGKINLAWQTKAYVDDVLSFSD